MDADFSIELGSDDPVLDFPWKDEAGNLLYVDIKRHPEQVDQIEEAQKFHEIKPFLCLVNSSRTSVETAKCDAWSTKELSEEEEIYDASCKFESYVDIVFSDLAETLSSPMRSKRRFSFSDHERFARKLVELLRLAPDISSAAEACVRRCFFAHGGGVQEGFYFTFYVRGYGRDEVEARQNWEVGLKLVGNAVVQLSATTNTSTNLLTSGN
jgi:hypothetical protein